MVVAKKGNHKARKESVTIPEQNRADLGMNGQGSRFGPLMIVNENDEGIISNNTTTVQESRRQSTISPTTHVTMPKRITKNSSITKTFTNPTFNNNANNAPPSDPSTMKHKGILHAHAKPNHGMNSKDPNKLMMNSTSAGFDEDPLLSLKHSNDPPDGRQPDFNQPEDDSEASDYMGDREEQDEESESAGSLASEDGIDAEQMVDTPDVYKTH
ncbi:hypothetical protein WN944_029374 [Citrus x changshan-huyou]|uniref:Uncharacterized protein n=1 Tax=Citrus x changshan-huyou TaxID=2935761 RepID=A0AAP0LL37_9ROSI